MDLPLTKHFCSRFKKVLSTTYTRMIRIFDILEHWKKCNDESIKENTHSLLKKMSFIDKSKDYIRKKCKRCGKPKCTKDLFSTSKPSIADTYSFKDFENM